jgi:hypothetical protein
LTPWAAIFLGIIAVATVTMAVVQVGVIVAAGRLARRVDRLADQVEQELKPLFAHVNAIGRDASRAMALATVQVERADKLFADISAKVDETVATLQSSLIAPAREGRALLAAFRAVIAAIRNARSRAGQAGADEEDALFI